MLPVTLVGHFISGLLSGPWHRAGALVEAHAALAQGIQAVAIALLAAHLLAPASASALDFGNAWLTPDQQGRLAYQRGDYSAAAGRFQNPMWKGVALYRSALYQDALDAFASIDTAESWYNQGNALLHLSKFEEAVAAYTKALERRADWPDAVANLAIARQLLKRQKDAEQEQEQNPNQKPDSVQFDDKGKKGKAGEMAVAEQTSDMWMKNIQVSPADLMARKFSIEAGGSRP